MTTPSSTTKLVTRRRRGDRLYIDAGNGQLIEVIIHETKREHVVLILKSNIETKIDVLKREEVRIK